MYIDLSCILCLASVKIVKIQAIFINFWFTHLFFQVHKAEIGALPEVLAGKVDLLPDLLQKRRALNTGRKYENSFTRREKWALNSGLGRGCILPAKAFTVDIYLC